MKLLPLISATAVSKPACDFSKFLLGLGFVTAGGTSFYRKGEFYGIKVEMEGKIAYIYSADQDEAEGYDTATELGMYHAREEVEINL